MISDLVHDQNDFNHLSDQNDQDFGSKAVSHALQINRFELTLFTSPCFAL